MTCHHIKFGGRARAILTVADDYKPGDQPPQDPSDYLGWHEWADVQHKAKLRQKQCGRCCLWRYPQELSRQIDRRQLSDSRGRKVDMAYPVCNKCANQPSPTAGPDDGQSGG